MSMRTALVTLGGVLLAGQLHAQGEIIDRVMVVVEGEAITQSDVDAAIALGLVGAAEPALGSPREAVLERLIDRALVLREVRRYVPLDPTPDALDARWQEIRARFRSSEAWVQALARSGMEEPRLREIVRDDLRIAAYLEERFASPPGPSDEEVVAYYNAHASELTRAGRLPPLADLRDDIRQRLGAERRAAIVGDWLSGLRRRYDVRRLSGAPEASPAP